MKNQHKFLKAVSSTTTMLFLALTSFAQAVTTAVAPAQTGVILNPLKGITSIPAFISTVLGYVVKIGGIIAIFAFIYSGYSFVKAKGNPAEITKAKLILQNTVIGVAILLGAQLIASIIVGTIRGLSS